MLLETTSVDEAKVIGGAGTEAWEVREYTSTTSLKVVLKRR